MRFLPDPMSTKTSVCDTRARQHGTQEHAARRSVLVVRALIRGRVVPIGAAGDRVDAVEAVDEEAAAAKQRAKEIGTHLYV